MMHMRIIMQGFKIHDACDLIPSPPSPFAVEWNPMPLLARRYAGNQQHLPTLRSVTSKIQERTDLASKDFFNPTNQSKRNGQDLILLEISEEQKEAGQPATRRERDLMVRRVLTLGRRRGGRWRRRAPSRRTRWIPSSSCSCYCCYSSSRPPRPLWRRRRRQAPAVGLGGGGKGSGRGGFVWSLLPQLVSAK